MKKNSLRFVWTFLLSIVFAGLTAQNIPINLLTGWNWIGYTCTEAIPLEEALAGFTPAEGDMIKGINGTSMYQNGQWQGSLTQLEPGLGYMYLSVSGESKSFVFGGSDADPSMLPETALEGEFTVDSKGTKVRFSPGNLQFRLDANKEVQCTVGTGVYTTGVVPYDTHYKYSLSQMVFRASELGAAGLFPTTIQGLAFESYSTNHYLRNGIEIWMSTTTLTTAPTTSVSTSGMTKVFSGSLVQQDGWTPVYFTTPFTWDGQSNVLVTVLMNHGSYSSSTLWQCSQMTFSAMSYAHRDGSDPYQPSSSTYTMTALTNRPNVRFIEKPGPMWRFATNQTDYIGADNASISSTYGGWIDLLGWGTSGHYHGAVSYQPWSTNQTESNYYAYGSSTANLNDQTGEADWGCNPISNGGDQPFRWRTLTKAEWAYLLASRSTSSGKRYAKAIVGGVNGVILLPDNWSVSYYYLNNTNTSSANYSSNTITVTEWHTLEQHGAVFLPAAGWRMGTGVQYDGSRGFYWTASNNSGGAGASGFNFTDEQVNYSSAWSRKYIGQSVRLVCQTNPIIRTIGVTNVTNFGATIHGEVQCLGSGTVDNHGFYYHTANGYNRLTVGYGTGSFNGPISGLSPGTTYSVRAFAKIDGNYYYGNCITFTTKALDEGAIPGQFSVSATKRVVFSKGNLQYQASTDTWRFASNQYSYIGDANSNASATYAGWIDLFGWGTSGHSHGAVCYQPWSTNQTNGNYYPYGSSTANLNDQNGQADWGCNPISNGGNLPNQWRTLTSDEWYYLFETRNTSTGIRYAKAKVNDVSGVILLPNNWQSSYFPLNNTNTADADFSSNVITAFQWNTLELHGAIFLPAAGYRYGTTVNNVGSVGNYWSTSVWSLTSHWAADVSFSYMSLVPVAHYYYYYGYSVRLVRDV